MTDTTTAQQRTATAEDAAATLTAEQTLEQVTAEVRMLCGCCGNNRARMHRIHQLLGLPVDDFMEEENL